MQTERIIRLSIGNLNPVSFTYARMDQFLAGNGFSMFLDYTQVARNMPTFYETNPDAEVIFVDPPMSPNGLSGVTCDNLSITMNWFVPASNTDKADLPFSSSTRL